MSIKALKVLNRINALSLGAYIPYIIIFHNDFFFGKNRASGIRVLCLLMFLTTFAAGFPALWVSENKNIDTSFGFSEILALGKGKVFTLLGVTAIGIVLILIYIHDTVTWFYVICSFVALIFVMGEAIVIQKIDVSPFFKISIPWYTYPLPFAFFFIGEFTVFNTIPEEKIDFPGIAIFVLSGILMVVVAWQTSYYVDEKAKTIEKEYGGIMSLFRKNAVIPFDKITLVKKQKLIYIIQSADEEFRINRFFSGAKRMKKVFYDNGIAIQ
jgi:hypothetical protein